MKKQRPKPAPRRKPPASKGRARAEVTPVLAKEAWETISKRGIDGLLDDACVTDQAERREMGRTLAMLAVEDMLAHGMHECVASTEHQGKLIERVDNDLKAWLTP